MKVIDIFTKKEKTKGSEENTDKGYDFGSVMKANKTAIEKWKKERAKINKSVLRSFRIKS